MKNTNKMRWLAGLAAILLLAGCGAKDDQANNTTGTKDTATTLATTTTEAADMTTSVNNVTEPTSTQAPTTTESTRKTVTTRSKVNTANDWDKLFPITPTKTPQQAAAAVTHKDGTVFTKIPKQTAAVTTYNKDWAFTHHPGIAYFNGKIYAMFSQHGTAADGANDSSAQHKYGEDFPGQRLVVSSSSNFYDWSEPKVVIDAFDGVMAKTSIIPCGIYVADGKLFVTAMSHDYGAVHFDSKGNFTGGGDDASATTTCYMSYTTDGVNWSTPAKYNSMVSDALRQTYAGRWLCVSGTRFYYTDKAKPDGFRWEMTGMTDTQIRDALNRLKSDKTISNPILTESTWYQTKDNVLFLMSRTNSGVMWLSQSYDGGDTWTDSYPTNFSSSNNQFPMGELADGSIYAVGTPYNKANQWEQWPLNLYISKDGYNFDVAYTISDEKYQLKQTGYSKGGYFGYPHTMIQGDYLYVLTSKQKEVMEIHRIKLSDIKY